MSSLVSKHCIRVGDPPPLNLRPFRRFALYQQGATDGLAGSGVVAVGVRLVSGRCILEWLEGSRTLTIYDSHEDMVSEILDVEVIYLDSVHQLWFATVANRSKGKEHGSPQSE